ncbi:MAG: serine/threonine-protein kinase [Myxococcales bacterium]
MKQARRKLGYLGVPLLRPRFPSAHVLPKALPEAEPFQPVCSGAARSVVHATVWSQRPPPAPPSPWLDRIIDDRYRIKELLAEGGMGTVFVAEHLRLRKMVALKTIHPSFLGNQEVAARFAREAMASAQLEHPHVASAMDYGTLPDGGAYLVLELVHGPNLRAHVDKVGGAPWQQVCEIGAQIADALSAAHAMGIVHRDLKPENVLLEARHGGPPFVKVLDFGIARIESPPTQETEGGGTGRALTKVGAVLGTPGYMAPEQAGGGPVDERADLYALGVLLWEMLAGRALFDAPNLTGIIAQQFSPTLAERIAQGTGTAPPELAALVHKLLAPQLSDRMQNAGLVRDQLRGLASRAAVPSAQAYGVSVPTVLRNAPPQLRSILDTVLTASPPRLRALWDFVDRLPRKVVWSSLAALLVVVTSVVMAAVKSEPEAKNTAPPAVSRVEAVAVSTPAPPVPPPLPPSASAPDVQSQIDVLSRSKNGRERAAAARWLVHPPTKVEIPPFATALARLELGTDCRVQTAALRRLRTLGDARSLPAVEYWYDKPRTGCGLLNRDCHACIREELNTTRRALKRAPAPEAAL